jgi:transcriptional regulator with XRE-family HTH domain
MIRPPLTPDLIAAGQRLGAALRTARGIRSQAEVALAAGISPETLRKIEGGRVPTPAFGTIVCLSEALGIPVADLAEVWLTGTPAGQLSSPA